MGEVTKQFGIQLPLLIASIINFFILLYLLKRFMYGPVIKMLDERKGIISKSLEDARKIEEDRKLTEERIKTNLRMANEQSLKTMEQARKSAQAMKEEIIKEAEGQAKQLVERAKAEIAQEKEGAAKALRSEAAQLIAKSLKQIMAGESGKEPDEKLIAQTLERIDG